MKDDVFVMHTDDTDCTDSHSCFALSVKRCKIYVICVLKGIERGKGI